MRVSRKSNWTSRSNTTLATGPKPTTDSQYGYISMYPRDTSYPKSKNSMQWNSNNERVYQVWLMRYFFTWRTTSELGFFFLSVSLHFWQSNNAFRLPNCPTERICGRVETETSPVQYAEQISKLCRKFHRLSTLRDKRRAFTWCASSPLTTVTLY